MFTKIWGGQKTKKTSFPVLPYHRAKRMTLLLCLPLFIFLCLILELYTPVIARTFYYEHFPVTTTGAKSVNNIVNANECLFTVEGNSIRYKKDGGVPTATEGHLVVPGGNGFALGIDDIRNLKMIGVSGTATVHISYSKENERN